MASTLIVSRDGLKGAALWAGWYRVRVPCCQSCGWRLQARRVFNVLLTLVIAGSSLAFGIVYLLPRLPGWACGLIVLFLCVLGFAIAFVWNRTCPAVFDVDPHDNYVEYEFTDARFYREFMELNFELANRGCGGCGPDSAGTAEAGIPRELLLVIVEDGTLELVESKLQATQIYEGVDVEAGVFRFYDAAGTYLEPRFTTPNRRGRILGFFPWVTSGEYDLLPSQHESEEDDIWVCLAETSILEPNPWFNSIDEVREFVAANRERG